MLADLDLLLTTVFCTADDLLPKKWSSPVSVDRVGLGGLGRSCRDLIFIVDGHGLEVRG